MTELRVHEKNGNYDEELRQQIRGDINKINKEIGELMKKRTELRKDLLNLDIAPFKLGDFALVEITVGRNKVWKKCLLEYDDGMLYARPVKEDGPLSKKHYSVYPFYHKTYSDYLKEVEE